MPICKVAHLLYTKAKPIVILDISTEPIGKMDKYELLDKANKFRALFVKKFVDLGVPIDKIKSPMTEVEGKYFFEVDIVNWNFCCQIFSYKYQNEKGQIVSNTFNECRFTDSFGNDFDTEINEELINLYILDVLVPEEHCLLL